MTELAYHHTSEGGGVVFFTHYPWPAFSARKSPIHQLHFTGTLMTREAKTLIFERERKARRMNDGSIGIELRNAITHYIYRDDEEIPRFTSLEFRCVWKR